MWGSPRWWTISSHLLILHGRANLTDINTKFACLVSIDLELILNAGQRATVLDLAQPIHGIDQGPYLRGGLHQCDAVI